MAEIKRQAIRHVSEKARGDILRVFKTEGKSHNANWESLKESTLRAKIKKGHSEKTLQRTTTLRQSFYVSDKGDHTIVGTPVFYGLFHEEGTNKIPARPFMKPVFEDIEKTASKIIDNLLRGV
jgi:HK97 gp10 family phage protein